ncbi:MAG: hypothetical protein RR652_02205, partial [Mucinivorans sp.]
MSDWITPICIISKADTLVEQSKSGLSNHSKLSSVAESNYFGRGFFFGSVSFWPQKEMNCGGRG